MHVSTTDKYFNLSDFGFRVGWWDGLNGLSLANKEEWFQIDYSDDDYDADGGDNDITNNWCRVMTTRKKSVG